MIFFAQGAQSIDPWSYQSMCRSLSMNFQRISASWLLALLTFYTTSYIKFQSTAVEGIWMWSKVLHKSLKIFKDMLKVNIAIPTTCTNKSTACNANARLLLSENSKKSLSVFIFQTSKKVSYSCPRDNFYSPQKWVQASILSVAHSFKTLIKLGTGKEDLWKIQLFGW